MRLLSIATCAALAAESLFAGHVIEVGGLLTAAEEGLILGNGDLSVSVYEEGDELVFRLGKGDVWDRRMDFSRSPRPLTHDEFVRGILDEGWTVGQYDGNSTRATKGTRDEKRMREICQGASSVFRYFPYPCPKPTGELRMRLPADLSRPEKFAHRLLIEEGRLLVAARWKGGAKLSVEAAIDPSANVLSVKWRLDGWTDETSPCKGRSPVVFRLLRRADRAPFEFAEAQGLEMGNDTDYSRWGDGKATPLDPPAVVRTPDGHAAIEQRFPADPTFPDGFAYRMTFDSRGMPGRKMCRDSRNVRSGGRDACILTIPSGKVVSGELAVSVTTSSDPSLDAPAVRPHADIVAAARTAAERDWRLSGVSFPSDPFLENLWYATYHVRRSVLKGGKVPPGLFLPSTLNDYSLWHGDYHSNYNYQSIYWGGFTANRLEDERACLTCTRYFLDIGRLRASRYYGMRGAFVPLEGFPVKPEEDWSTSLPLGRMTYMTGWAAIPFWEYYLHTLDRDWLRTEGYPAIRDCALFCLDFLKKAPSKDLPPELKDGLYHCFPSIEEEYAIKSPADVTDRPQVVAFTRAALYMAIEASKALDTDADLRAAWQDRLDNLACTARDLKGYAKHCYLANSPEFGYRTPVPKPAADWSGEPKRWNPGWYFGHTVRSRVTALRTNGFVPGRDFDEYRKSLEFWAHPNGLVWGMCIGIYGRAGGWTETLSCMAPLQEMMLQSWDGAIRLFPYWPKDRDAAFTTFRAQGAFLVSSEWKSGRIGRTTVFSEKGADCHVHGKWRVRNAAGSEVATGQDGFGRMCFKTSAGETYHLTRP